MTNPKNTMPHTKPSTKTVLEARQAAGLTQTEAAAVVYRTLRNWQQWEAGDRQMDAALFELFCLKCGINQDGLDQKCE